MVFISCRRHRWDDLVVGKDVESYFYHERQFLTKHSMILGVDAVFCFGRPIIEVDTMQKRMRYACVCVVQQILVVQLANWSSVDIIFTYLHVFVEHTGSTYMDIKVNRYILVDALKHEGGQARVFYPWCFSRQ
jgi:hypothetical protein